MVKIFLIMIGGSVGAVCRYSVNLLAAKFWGSAFSWGTLMVNLCGCFLIGLVFGLAERAEWVTPLFRLFFVTGFLGALTTFSSFAVETVNLAIAGHRLPAAANFLINNTGGLVLVLLGLGLAKII
jgi:fluoride exporter